MLTFEKIRELERGEREAKQLQKMPENFFDDLADYLKKKEEINEKTSTDIMEIENVKATIRRLFEIRERKMMDMMIYTLRTGMIPENLTNNEEQSFFAVLEIMKNHRENFFSFRSGEKKEKNTYFVARKSLPAFIGPDLNTYEIHENSIYSLDTFPKPLNDLLLKKGIIEIVEE